MKRLLGWSVATIAVLAALSPGMTIAQDAGDAAAVADSGGVTVDANVTAVEGAVDIKRPKDEEWVPAEVGMKLPRATEVSTGPDSTMVLDVGDNVQVTIAPLTQGSIAQFSVAGDTQKTKMKLDIGSMKVEVKKGTLKTDLKVATPNSTASVSGSAADVSYFPDTGTNVDCTDDACTVSRHQDRGQDETRGGGTDSTGKPDETGKPAGTPGGGPGGTPGEEEEEVIEEEPEPELGEEVEILVGEECQVTEDSANSDEMIYDTEIAQDEVVVDTLPIGTTDVEAEAAVDSGCTDVSGAEVNSDLSTQGSTAEDTTTATEEIIEESNPDAGSSGGELPAPPSPPQ